MKRLWNTERAVLVAEGFCPEGHGKLKVRDVPAGYALPHGATQAGACEDCARDDGALLVLHAAGTPNDTDVARQLDDKEDPVNTHA